MTVVGLGSSCLKNYIYRVVVVGRVGKNTKAYFEGRTNKICKWIGCRL